jgi:hypothetical protein
MLLLYNIYCFYGVSTRYSALEQYSLLEPRDSTWG